MVPEIPEIAAKAKEKQKETKSSSEALGLVAAALAGGVRCESRCLRVSWGGGATSKLDDSYEPCPDIKPRVGIHPDCYTKPWAKRFVGPHGRQVMSVRADAFVERL